MATGAHSWPTVEEIAPGNPGHAEWMQVQLGQKGGHVAPDGSSSSEQRSEQPASSRPANADTSGPAPESCSTSIREHNRSTARINRPAGRETKRLSVLARAEGLVKNGFTLAIL